MSQGELREFRVGLVHGQMDRKQKSQAMESFRAGQTQVLVTTTVIEVGVDVPEATVMMVLDADRFGLAQLHQLRGRVGRGEAESYCVLVTERYPHDPANPADDEEATVAARLDALVATTDGFVLAEKDLEQRREGELLGLSQSGLPPLRVALFRADEVEIERTFLFDVLGLLTMPIRTDLEQRRFELTRNRIAADVAHRPVNDDTDTTGVPRRRR